jgi:NAD(P)-dependent dehydrogenase (short-subunit alcohol dehydrogenase family)
VVPKEFSLEGKQALVTGAGHGIGRGIALVLAEAGADVAVTALHPEGINKVAEEIRRAGRRALPVVSDATVPEEVDRLKAHVLETFGGLEVLVTTVGGMSRKPVVTLPGKEDPGMSAEDWRSIVDFNLTEAFLACRTFGPHFLEQRKGSVVHISSWAALRASAQTTAYDTAKAGLVQFTRSLALEWAPYGVRVNAIAPGNFPDVEEMPPEAARRWQERMVARIPLGRLGKPREVGLLAVYLASDASAFVTGQAFVIDGGMTIA